jgi:hypothetical protein
VDQKVIELGLKERKSKPMNEESTKQQREGRNTMALGAIVRRNRIGGIALIVFSLMWFDACSSGSQGNTNANANPKVDASKAPATPATTAGTTQESPPASLADAGEYGENIYDYAKANDWSNAAVKLAALKGAIKQVHTDVKNQSAAVEGLDTDVAALDRAVTAKDRQAAMQEANQVTLDIASLTAAYKLSVPVEVTRLDYYGRELEVWALVKDATKLQTTADEMRRTWDSLRPTIAAKSAAEANKFDALVARVEAAKTPADYARVATLELDEVDNLEKLFH